MANIVEGLFGLTPSQVQQQQQAQINAQAVQYAQADPFQRAAIGMYQGGAGLAGIGAGMMGLQNKDVTAAQEQQQFASQIDMTTPEGVMEGAKAAQARGDSSMAVKLVALARQMQEEQSTAAYRDAQSKQMLASAEGKQSSATQATSAYAKELVDAGYAYGTPEFNAKMREYLAGKTRGGRVGGGGGGSGLTPAQSAKAAMEQSKAEESKISAADSMRTMLDSANALLEHPGRIIGTGASSIVAPYLLGTKGKDFSAQLDTFKSQTFIPMVSKLKGMGALSDAEGKKLTQAVGALDPGMSEQAFKESLNNIIDEMNMLYTRNTGVAWTPTTSKTMRDDVISGRNSIAGTVTRPKAATPSGVKVWNPTTGRWENK